jgi:hypothetical protein
MGQLGHSGSASEETMMRRRNDFSRLTIWLRRTTRFTASWDCWRASAAIRPRRLPTCARPSTLNPQNLRALYQLAEETERQGATDSEAEFQQLVQKILAVQPNNLAALARVEPHRRETRRRRHCKIGGRANQRPIFELAP